MERPLRARGGNLLPLPAGDFFDHPYLGLTRIDLILSNPLDGPPGGLCRQAFVFKGNFSILKHFLKTCHMRTLRGGAHSRHALSSFFTTLVGARFLPPYRF
jgi:hypothetical protein